uniref:Uncharacterized protein n=1 Tax=Arion vulgaris TaxID=1028688 RepID=A0A0B6ZLF9_9EUPU
MSIIRMGAHVLRRLSLSSKPGRRNYTHVSQPHYKIEQHGVAQTQRKSGGWVIPTTLVLVGLGFSTFSTHQLVSCSDSVKMLSSFSNKK